MGGEGREGVNRLFFFFQTNYFLKGDNSLVMVYC